MIKANEKDYQELLLSLLPPGNIARDEDSNFGFIFGLLAKEFARIDADARGLIEEADPRTTEQLFEDWEVFAKLPDPCSPADQTKEERRNRLIQKLTKQGGQSRLFYEGVAQELLYDITIKVYRPFICGISQCIESTDEISITICPPQDRFIWTVTVHGARATWFKCGLSELGIDPFLKLTIATDLECIFSALKQSHTHLNFIYEEA